MGFREEIDGREAEVKGEIQVYLIVRRIGDEDYGCHIPARSWREAQAIAKAIKGKVRGISKRFVLDTVCPLCSGEVEVDTSKPEVYNDDQEWQEEFEYL